jgi:4-aminobutyrate aminotransferase
MSQQNLIERSKHCLSNVLGHATQLEIDRGSGAYLFSRDGKKYLDFGAGVAVNATGHCHPDVVTAIKTQAETLLHGCAGIVYYPQNIELAEKLSSITNGLDSVFFTQSGTEAVEAALKCATYTQNKQTIVAFNGSFHGRTLGALSVTTSNKKYTERYPLAFTDTIVLEYPYFYKNTAPLNTEESYLSYLNTQLAQLPNTIAAIIIEPFLGEGGYVPAPTSVLQTLRTWCTKNNVLLIFDEIQSGIGRTGAWFNYHHHNVVPDILTTAKGIASGLPLGACISTKTIMDQWTTGSHGGTYGGNPISCAAGSATLNIVEPLLPNIQALGEHTLQRLTTELNDCSNIAEIRGKGLMIGIEFKQENGTPNADIVTNIRTACLEQQLLILSCGKHGNVIRLMPPLTISKKTLDKGLDTLISICQQQ